MKVAFLVVYFGHFPTYYQLFLDSCKYNPTFDWIIISDDMTSYEYPPNVHFIPMTFSECKHLIQSKFHFKICLETPQKLCDYKCAYGYIFQDFIKEYDWWGYCDLDQIFGDLHKFISDDQLRKYDKIGSLGHLTLYRNCAKNNMIFSSNLNGKQRYKEVFTSNYGCAFDEWLPESINDIYTALNIPTYLVNLGADVNPYYTTFSLVFFDVNQRKYYLDKIKNSIFCWEKGTLFQIYKEAGCIKQREFPYVHLQKRKMKDHRTYKDSQKYYIIPNKFIDCRHHPSHVLTMCKVWNFLNYQFFLVKLKSLRQRIRNKDWAFHNVFK